MMIKGKRILFIGPIFHRYEERIIDTLESFGAEVSFYPERSYNLFYSLLNNTSKFLLKKYQSYHYFRFLRGCSDPTFDILFVIRGCQFPEDFIEKISAYNPEIYRIMYQWDSEYNNSYIHLTHLFNEIVTFDKADSLKYNVRYLPLFYDIVANELVEIVDASHELDFFCLCSYSYYRLNVLKRLTSILKNYKVKAVVYIPKSTYFKEKLKGVNFEDINLVFSPISHEEYLKDLRRSQIILDISPPSQSGLPMRVIEAIGFRKKVLSTNGYVLKEFPDLDCVSFLNTGDSNDVISSQIMLFYQERTSNYIDGYDLNNWVMNLFKNYNSLK